MSTASSNRPLLQSAVALLSALLLGAGGLLLGFGLMIPAVIALTLVGLELTPSLNIVLSLLFIQGVGCAGVAFSYVKARPAVAPWVRSKLGIVAESSVFDIPAEVPDLRDAITVGVGYCVALGGAILGSVLITLAQRLTGTELETGTNQAAQIGMENPELLLLLIPASVLVIGPSEELLFRGVVQGRVREVFSPVPGILIPSAIFAGLHWFALTGGSASGNFVALGILLVPALVFGISYEYTDNIVVPSLIHGVYNATLFTLLYVTVAYSDQFEAAQQALLAASL
ncbi:CPBP family intramembrane metalloprotease [Halomicroarcula limicola]|uniref:CPBP family intramembrane metalloprotease n=1 Tax=Haloarcula limicola TaxID=1429915 RepID=A0A8J7Y6Y3_9EURY|nr:CPBP family intramembrane glutamic endopeptidase [Halomicroarcula limicola]MBV0923221.1 CPBP family intramembrane metalloprotease [Halomicroarcula limicola]